MDLAEEIKKDLPKWVKEGRFKATCKPDPNEPGKYVCKGILMNEDGKTYTKGEIIIKVKEETPGNFIIEPIPSGEKEEEQDPRVQIALLEYFKTFYKIR